LYGGSIFSFLRNIFPLRIVCSVHFPIYSLGC
jgi:hypothetical protein